MIPYIIMSLLYNFSITQRQLYCYSVIYIITVDARPQERFNAQSATPQTGRAGPARSVPVALVAGRRPAALAPPPRLRPASAAVALWFPVFYFLREQHYIYEYMNMYIYIYIYIIR